MKKQGSKIQILPVLRLSDEQVAHVSSGKVYACGNVSNPSCQTLCVQTKELFEYGGDVPRVLTLIM